MSKWDPIPSVRSELYSIGRFQKYFGRVSFTFRALFIDQQGRPKYFLHYFFWWDGAISFSRIFARSVAQPPCFPHLVYGTHLFTRVLIVTTNRQQSLEYHPRVNQEPYFESVFARTSSLADLYSGIWSAGRGQPMKRWKVHEAQIAFILRE